MVIWSQKLLRTYQNYREEGNLEIREVLFFRTIPKGATFRGSGFLQGS